MAFKTFEFHGGVIVPGTLRLEAMEREGCSGFAVIAGVFDTSLYPGRKEEFFIGWAQYYGVAELMLDWIDSGGKDELDIKKVLYPRVKTKRAYTRRAHNVQLVQWERGM